MKFGEVLSAMKSLNVIVHGWVREYYKRHALIVAHFPWTFIIIPLTLTVFLATGFHRIIIEDDIEVLYSPKNSMVPQEAAVHDSFYTWSPPSKSLKKRSVELTGEEFSSSYMYTVLKHNDYENVLHQNACRALVDIHENFVQNLIKLYRSHGMSDRIDVDIFMLDGINLPLLRFCQLFFTEPMRHNPNVRLTYPFMEAYGVKIGLESALGGVEQHPNGSVASARIMRLLHFWYNNQERGLNKSFLSDLDLFIRHRLMNTNFSHVFVNQDLISDDIFKNVTYTLPYLGISAVLLLSFIIVSTSSTNPIRSKSIPGAMGCLCSFMAVTSSFGLLFYLGVPFNPIVSVTPFIALAIGIDDTFLAISAWQQTDFNLSAEQRMILSLQESASAITVTAFTDIALFSIGTISDTLAIQIFSVFVAVTMAFDFLYQITFFAGVLMISGRREQYGSFDVLCMCFRMSHDSESSVKKATADMSNYSIDFLFREYFGNALNNQVVRIFAVVTFSIYVILAFWGCCHLLIDMKITMLLVDDSPLQPYFHFKNKYERSAVSVTVHVLKPPDLNDDQDVNNFMNLVQSLESLKYSTGPDSSLLWLKDYLQFVQSDAIFAQNSLDSFEEFLNRYQYQLYRSDIRWYREKNGQPKIDRFLFHSYFNTSGHWSRMTDLLKQLRATAKQYKQYEVSIYIADSAMWDLMLNSADNTLQTVGVGILCMVLMSAVFIPNACSIFWVSFTLASMDLGVIGFLSLWGVKLNPVSVINIILSLDFPTEYATHICHCFYKLNEDDPQERLKITLGTVVVVIGMLHALLWLPIFLTVTSAAYQPKLSTTSKLKQNTT
ncbi:unnamed protein product [Soboliphyme baturini]|uniref:SSD domain-containing protein n=1 Tax=Soboliphyme baturini TaxID=241478 RepID=A0A183IHQ4_9BILA|nr:unnamed protein product [Soboliphyme baturini]